MTEREANGMLEQTTWMLEEAKAALDTTDIGVLCLVIDKLPVNNEELLKLNTELELMGALLGARTADFLISCFSYQRQLQSFYWTDSSTCFTGYGEIHRSGVNLSGIG